MKTTHHTKSERIVSELAMLSNDPALTSEPDPKFRPKFRNPDEIMQDDFNWDNLGSSPRPTLPPTWASPAFCRRSPKD